MQGTAAVNPGIVYSICDLPVFLIPTRHGKIIVTRKLINRASAVPVLQDCGSTVMRRRTGCIQMIMALRKTIKKP
jgi:hypothetical protein